MPLPFLALFLVVAEPASIPAGSATLALDVGHAAKEMFAHPNCDDARFGKPARK
jgi:hypothetical protein